MSHSQDKKAGKVYLVGAGPGDPGLMTLRGVECLGRAELVLHDYLVNPRILRHAAPTAQLVCLGHHSKQRTVEQHEINRLMVEGALDGKTVVRLKGGDPAVFGRTADEIQALRAAGLAYEIVPGITAALAAGGYAEIPLTHADHSSCLALVTGQERRGKKGPALDYHALAGFPGTLVFYMGIRSAPTWSEALIRGGKPADTPVAIVRRCTLPDQAIVRCTLGTVAEVIRRERLRPPAVTIVGNVAGLAPDVTWFASQPLFGKTVLVTRPRHQAETLCDRLAELGARVLVQPVIEIGPCEQLNLLDQAIERLDAYDWLVFSSANGVRYLLQRLIAQGRDLRALGRIKLAAIGPGTAAELATWKLNADLVPDQYRAETLADALAAEVAGKRVLLARASRGREILAERLVEVGADVQQAIVYSSTDVQALDPQVEAQWHAGRVDWVTVTSSAIARSAARLLGASFSTAKLASISPVTTETLRELNCQPTAEATEYTIEGLVEAIVQSELKEMGEP